MGHYKDKEKRKVYVGFTTDRRARQFIEEQAKIHRVSKSEFITNVLLMVRNGVKSGIMKIEI